MIIKLKPFSLWNTHVTENIIIQRTQMIREMASQDYIYAWTLTVVHVEDPEEPAGTETILGSCSYLSEEAYHEAKHRIVKYFLP